MKKIIMLAASFASIISSNLLVSGPQEDADELKQMFSQVRFHNALNNSPLSVSFLDNQQGDVEIRFSNIITAPQKKNKPTDLEIRFRDVPHLFNLNKRYIDTNVDQIYFIWDKNVQTDKEILLSNGKVPSVSKVVQITTNYKIKLQGQLNSGYPLYYPSDSDTKNFSCRINNNNNNDQGNTIVFNGKKTKLTASLDSLAPIISSFDKKSDLYRRDEEASRIIGGYVKDKNENPDKYSQMVDSKLEKCVLLSDEGLKVNSIGNISSSSPIIYFASSVGEFNKLKKSFPVFDKTPPCCLNTNFQGVFSESSLNLSEGISMKTSGNLLTYGQIDMPTYYLKIKTGKGLVNIMGINANNFSGLSGYNLIMLGDLKKAVSSFLTEKTDLHGIPAGLWFILVNDLVNNKLLTLKFTENGQLSSFNFTK